MAFGDVLRGLGSVLNPAVAQEAAQEDAQQRGLAGQVGLMKLKQEIESKSPEYQARVEALNNEKAFRLAAREAGGDQAKLASAAVQYGKPELAVSLYNQQEQRAARLQEKEQQLRVELTKMAEASTQKDLDRDSKERLAASAEETKRYLAGITAELARSNQALKKMQFTTQADQALVKKTQQLGAALEKSGLPEIDSVLGAVEDSLKKTPDLASYISGPKSLLPDMVIGADLAAGKQAFQKLFNITLKSRSGSAVTNQELERLKSEFAAGAFKTPAQLQKAVDQARNIIQKHYASVTAGFGNDALEAYNENMRGLGGRVVLEPVKTDKSADPLGIR